MEAPFCSHALELQAFINFPEDDVANCRLMRISFLISTPPDSNIWSGGKTRHWVGVRGMRFCCREIIVGYAIVQVVSTGVKGDSTGVKGDLQRSSGGLHEGCKSRSRNFGHPLPCCGSRHAVLACSLHRNSSRSASQTQACCCIPGTSLICL